MKQRCSSNDIIEINDKTRRGCHEFYVGWRKRGRELTNGETERECVRGRASVRREIALVQRFHKHIMEM
jgi:hypothetical protein